MSPIVSSTPQNSSLRSAFTVHETPLSAVQRNLPYGTVTPPTHLTPPGSVALTPISGQSGSASFGSTEDRRRPMEEYDSDDMECDMTFATNPGK